MSGSDHLGAVPPSRRLGRPSAFAYGLGSVAYGVKDNGFQTFLLLFYNQVIGLSAISVGIVIMSALVVDAVIDPVIGAASDRTQGRWGRRHPWMYASALPIAIGWLLLWNPPALSHAGSLAWVFATSIIVRSAVSAYEVPSSALTPELTADYDERTRITAYRFLFGWGGGLAMLLAAYTIFLVPVPGQSNGLLNRQGYEAYALTGAVAMFVAILVSAAGTHHQVKYLPKPVIQQLSVVEIAGELLQSIKNRAFAILMAATLFSYLAQGVSFALSNYFYSFVWHLKGIQLLVLTGALFAGVLVAFAIGPRFSVRFGKRQASCVFMALGTTLLTIPYFLRAVDLFPDAGGSTMLLILFPLITANIACTVSSLMIGGAMIADVVEQSEVLTGRRSEGVFFAGNFFVQKASSGIAIFIAGGIISLVSFPTDAQPGAVAAGALDHLSIAFCLIYLALGWAAAWLYLCFPFGRDEHDAHVRTLSTAPSEASSGFARDASYAVAPPPRNTQEIPNA